MNIESAKAVADAVRTSLGPRGMDKMVGGSIALFMGSELHVLNTIVKVPNGPIGPFQCLSMRPSISNLTPLLVGAIQHDRRYRAARVAARMCWSAHAGQCA
jgi:hypothetical protein